MGVVYFVTDTSPQCLPDSEKNFVLKTHLEALTGPAKASFFHEAETWVKLGRHPNVVPAYWVQEIAGRIFVAAAEIKPDPSGRVGLDEYLQSEPRPLAETLRWAAHFCYGMEHAAAHGLSAHRDIKPQNLLVGESGELQIADFGLANLQQTMSQDHRVGGARGHLATGTPAYMPPEQWHGRVCDVRTDIYAFGIVLYQLCYGKLPWRGEALNEVAEFHLKVMPELPEHPLAELIGTSLAKAPEDRFQTTADLLEAVSRRAKDLKIGIPPRPAVTDEAYLRRANLRTHSTLSATTDKTPAIQAARKLVDEWPDDASGWTQLGRLMLETGALEEAKSATRRSISLDPNRTAAWNNLGVICNRQGDYLEATKAFEHALRCDPENSGAMMNLAVAVHAIGDVRKALSHFQHATRLAPDKYNAWFGLGVCLKEIGKREEGIAALREALREAPDVDKARIQREIDNA